ncbi:hypothetical protein LX32DRAFT_21337 [Colletotrichum zoysiae]|uniref:Uncharacterized protein n=1 Tax=Colletotrichum zoysiae TaxID=1216348 RepID=A0AAD9HCN5_9PEZI|nr:hypothetical protein LX32DRAFT_21337 [Colletotrichum zoysiae]
MDGWFGLNGPLPPIIQQVFSPCPPNRFLEGNGINADGVPTENPPRKSVGTPPPLPFSSLPVSSSGGGAHERSHAPTGFSVVGFGVITKTGGSRVGEQGGEGGDEPAAGETRKRASRPVAFSCPCLKKGNGKVEGPKKKKGSHRGFQRRWAVVYLCVCVLRTYGYIWVCMGVCVRGHAPRRHEPIKTSRRGYGYLSTSPSPPFLGLSHTPTP